MSKLVTESAIEFEEPLTTPVGKTVGLFEPLSTPTPPNNTSSVIVPPSETASLIVIELLLIEVPSTWMNLKLSLII